jgi:hypothetical protein
VCRTPRSAVLLIAVVTWFATAHALAQAPASTPPAAPGLTRDEMRQFLLTAKVTRSRDIGKGVTRPLRLTLTDGTLTHDAAFQSVDEVSRFENLRGTGGVGAELNLVDAYRYNLAAESLAVALGLEEMVPVHVERRWNGRIGALSWWVDTMMDEAERRQKGVQPPNADAWNRQMYRMRVFAALVRDTDRNLGNVLVTPDWRIVMIDFTRAFRIQPLLGDTAALPRCDRALLTRMQGLTAEGVKQIVMEQLTPSEINSVIKRRDLLVTHFQQLALKRGEAAVFY